MNTMFLSSNENKRFSRWILISIVFASLILVITGNIAVYANPAGQEDTASPSIMDEVKKLDEEFVDMGAKITALDEYAPTNFPDFKDLELANQLMELLDFNKRKADLLVQQYNVLEDKLFPLVLEHIKTNKTDIPVLAEKLKDYLGESGMSFYKLQKDINRVFLQIERLEKKLERLQVTARNQEIEKENQQKLKDVDVTKSISGGILQLEEELKNFNREIEDEQAKLADLKEKETKHAAKVEEKKNEVEEFKQKAAKADNRVDKIIDTAYAKVREIRLNGLEIPRLNAVRTFIYLSETTIKTLKKKAAGDREEIDTLKSQRIQKIFITLGKGLIIIVIALIAVFIILRVSQRISQNILNRIDESSALDSHRKQRYQTLSSVILTFIRVAVWIMAVLWVLGELEIDYAPFLVAAGGVSLAIGFGAQSLVKDIVSGFFILMEEQFALGDGVEVNGVSGSVEKITLRTIKIRSLDGTLHTIPNGSIAKVSNKTYQWSRAVVKVGASYDDDPQKVLDVLNQVAKEMYDDPEWNDKFLEEPSAQGILSFGESAIDYRILAKTDAGQQWGVGREMHIRVKKAFDEAGIEIPYNYMNVNILEHTKVEQE